MAEIGIEMIMTTTTIKTAGYKRSWSAILAAFLVLVPCSVGAPVWAQTSAQAAALQHLAGSRPADADPKDVQATTVPLYLPVGLAFDSAHNIFIADRDNHLIREVTVAGIITTVAGTGEQGFSGDGGPATAAMFDSPSGLAIDGAGNIFVADSHNHRIRRITAGTVTTIAGTGAADFFGDGGPGTAAALNFPTAVAVDLLGNLYIADTNNHRIREISGPTISTIAGDGEETFSGDGSPATLAGLDSPNGVAVDVAGNVYIGDTQNQRVREISAGTGIISTLAGTGTKSFGGDGGGANQAGLANPRGVAATSDGNVYVADSDNNRIRNISSGSIATVVGDGSQGFSGDTAAASAASLDTPRAVAVNFFGGMALSDSSNQRVREFIGGNIDTIAGIAPTNTEGLSLAGVSTAIYGAGNLQANFSNGNNVATGTVTLLDISNGGIAIGSGALAGNVALMSLGGSGVGPHALAATYPGDSANPAVASGIFVLNVTPAQLTAFADPVSLAYGATVPAITGSITGVLNQDSGNITARFSTLATSTSPVGIYPIEVTITGSASGNYATALSPDSGSVTISKAGTTVALTSSNANPAPGASVQLSAQAVSATSGTPTGSFTFYNADVALSAAVPVNGSGQATYSTAALNPGTQAITAVYSGDTNFNGNTSAPFVETLPLLGFSLGATPSTQTASLGEPVSFSIALTPESSTFGSVITLTASGLPAGATATFSKNSIAAGSASTSTTLTVQTSQPAATFNWPTHWQNTPPTLPLLVSGMLLLPFLWGRKRNAPLARRRGQTLTTASLLFALGALTACGGSKLSTHSQQSFSITVTATGAASGNAAAVTHTTILTLNLD